MLAVMNRRPASRRGRLLIATASAMTIAASLAGQAVAQDSASTDAEVSEVVVTGTQIRGVAPVGSTIISLGRQDLAKTGAGTTSDFLRQLPQVLNYGASDDLAGGAAVQNSRLNTVFARSVNLRGLGTKATLPLLNSHKVVPGSVGQLFDIDVLPAAALERMEVVADGASAIYGADAVAGVANFIMRRPFNGAETSARYGYAEGGRKEWSVSQLLGKSWDSGGFVVTYERSHRDQLMASERADLYNDDLSPFGGAPSSQNANPGNLIFNGVAYAIPSGFNGQGLTLSQLGPAGQPNRQNGWFGAPVIPDADRDSVALVAEQHIGSKVRLFGDFLYSKRSYGGSTTPAAANSAGLNVPSTNPFSPCAPGKSTANTQGLTCPANGNVSVAYNFLYDLGPQLREGYTRFYTFTVGGDVELPRDWKATAFATYGRNFDYTINKNQPNTAALNSVLGVATAAPKPAEIQYFNPFCDGRAVRCNDFATVNYFRGYQENTSENLFWDYVLQANGPLFKLPGGDVRLAVGGQFSRGHLTIINITATSTPLPTQARRTFNPTSARSVKSAFAELYVPLIGADNALPLVRALDLNIAGRYDDYSDFGNTTNPKVGVNWTVVDGVKLRGSYGKSFRAPTLQEINPYAAAGFLNGQVASSLIVPNGVALPAGNMSVIEPIGGNDSLRPEKATTWSFGVDFAPPQIPGFTASVNYYKIKYIDKIDTAAYNAGIAAAFNSGLYNDFLVLNPTYFPTRSKLTQAEFNAAVNATFNTPGLSFLGVPPPISNVLGIMDSRSKNSGIIDTDGIDVSARYRFGTGFGDITLGADATYVMSYKTGPVPAAPITERVNYFGYPLEWRARFTASWQRGGWSLSGYANYSNPYNIDRSQIPVGASSQYLDIASYTTFDFTLRYDTGPEAGWAKNIALSLSAQNLFDETPPLVLNTGSTAIRFDPQNASPLGRIVSAQITKRW